jgi:hypothetical protein
VALNAPAILIFVGIISGAHSNRGLGLEFLRHIERTHVLCYVIDMGSDIPGRLPWEDLMVLREELLLYKPVSGGKREGRDACEDGGNRGTREGQSRARAK